MSVVVGKDWYSNIVTLLWKRILAIVQVARRQQSQSRSVRASLSWRFSRQPGAA